MRGVIRVGHSPAKYKQALLGIYIVLLGLSACSNGHYYLDDPGLTKMPTRVKGTADARVITLQNKFAKGSVQVVTIGQDYLVSIPAQLLFPNESPQLTWQSYALLNQVVDFLQQFRKVTVNVTGYSMPYVSVRREDALTLARAKSVSNYLWSQGIDSRFIFAEGAGRDKPIAGDPTGGDASVNSRIEITFQDAII